MVSPDLMAMFEDLERNSEPKSKDVIVRAPFGYPGGKSRSADKILPHLPYRDSYIEVFGGTGIILLSRHKSPLEVFNDRYAGVVAFYRCLNDRHKMDALCDRLEITLHSREEFVWCKETWLTCEDDVERAARWFYMTQYSFGSKGRNFGRSVTARGHMAGKIQNRIKEFPRLHERMVKVQVENQEWQDCLADYDNPDAVFYLDPPYIDAYPGTYKHEMAQQDHRLMLDIIFGMKGFVALSGYSNPLYEACDWDHRFEWEVFISIKGAAFTEGNNKQDMESQDKRGHATEVLWVKEAR